MHLAFRIFSVLLTLLPLAVGARPESDLDAQIRAELEQSGVRGTSYAIFDSEGLLAEGALGQADHEHGRAMSTQTLMRAGSITKTLTAMAVLRLVERGEFQLASPVHELLPEAPIVNPWQATDPIRVAHLLEHSAGFDDTSFSKLFVTEERRGGHLAALLADPRPLAARWRPGTMMSYANPGYVVLAALIEKRTGKSWEEVVRTEVLQPLGMQHSVLSIAEATGREHAIGYRGAAMQAVPTLAMPDRAAGALWSTPADLAILARFLMSDGASVPGLLAPATVRAMKSAHTTLAARAGLTWGYGYGVQHRAMRELEWIGHDGSVYGAGAAMWYQPQRRLGYVVMVNTDEVGSTEDPLVDFIVQKPGAAIAALPSQPIAVDVDVEGWYRRRDARPELGAGINWLLGVVKVWRDPVSKDKLYVQEPLSEPSAYRSTDGHLLASERNGLLRSALILADEPASKDYVQAIDLNGGFFMQRTSALSALAPLVIGALSVLALLSAPFGRRRALNNPWLRRLPTLALVSLLVFVLLMFQLELTSIGEINAVGVGILISTTCFPLLAAAGLLLSVLTWRKETATLAKVRCLAASAGATLIAIFLAAFHAFALRIWQW